MIEWDDLDARLGAFAGQPVPNRLSARTDEVRRRIAGRRPPRPAPHGLVAAAIGGAALVGISGGALPSTAALAAPAPALQPEWALAPSTLLGGQ